MNRWIETLAEDKLKAWIAKNGGGAMQAHMTEDPYFALWLEYLDRATARAIGLSYQDLEDWDYWAAYDADMTPSEAARQMLGDNGWDF